jgi:hypothetical protein
LAFELCTEPLLAELKAILAVPEFKVRLPGGSRPSQNDLFVLARSSAGPVSIMVEGKVSESFGPTLEEWQGQVSAGKVERLAFLLETLGLPTVLEGSIRYQLLHRTASAILEGERYRAAAAVMLVHSFSQENDCWPYFRDFVGLFGVEAKLGRIQRLPAPTRIPLFAGWVIGDPRFLLS